MRQDSTKKLYRTLWESAVGRLPVVRRGVQCIREHEYEGGKGIYSSTRWLMADNVLLYLLQATI